MRRFMQGFEKRLAFALLAALGAQYAWGQPTTLTLRAKLRDFRDDPGSVNKHPDFHNETYFACGSLNDPNPGYVRATIITTDAPNAQFPGDNRGPDLIKLSGARPNTPCYTSFERFREWYNDVQGVNRSFYYDLVLTRNANGTYTYNNDKFFPLDSGEAWRKFNPADDPNPFGMRTQVETHNYGFTLEIHTSFTYIAGTNQVFDFRGDDDTWVFINGRLAIDLGGLRSATARTVNLDAQAAALNLTSGQAYPMDIFFAERYAFGSHFRISTSLLLGPQPPTLPMPVATPPGGVYANSPLSVALSVPGQPADSVRIYYTLDGSAPDSNGTLYAGPLSVVIPVAGATTLRAKAYRAGWISSPISNDVYTRQPIALPMPVADPPGQPFNPSISVALSVPGHNDARIYYTTDGSNPDSTDAPYSNNLVFTQTTTLKARAYKTGWLPSPIMTEVYTREFSTLPTPVANPPGPPPGRGFLYSIDVGLSVPGHADAQIRYTVDGSDPTPQSPLYSGPLTFTQNTTLKARAYKTDWLPSGASNDVYVREFETLPKPVATPPGQDFLPSITVSLAVPGHNDAEIRYTSDGSDPTPQSPLYAGPLTFTDTTTLKARAYKPEWLPSAVMTEVYNLKILPNNIAIEFKRPLTGRLDGVLPAYPPEVLVKPFGILSGDSTNPNPQCLNCRPGTAPFFLQPVPHAEWSVRTKSPFRYTWHIFDNLGNFVVQDEGEVTQAMLDQAGPLDAEGYRTVRFRWLHVSQQGRHVGTGVYVLKGRVASRRIANDPRQGNSEDVIVRLFGYQRRMQPVPN